MNLLINLLIFIILLCYSQEIPDYKKMIQEALKLQQSLNTSRDIRVERISGSVKIISVGGDEKELVDTYQYPLESGDIIRTGYDGSVMIYIDNFVAIKINRNSEFEITDNSKEPVFTLNFGSIISKVEKLLKEKFQFKIKTIQAVCAVRGTEFAVEHLKLTGESVFGVYDEGELIIYPEDGEDDESKAIKLTKNSEIVFSNQTKIRRIVKLSRMLRYKHNLIDIKKRLLSHKKRWKRFNEEQRIKYRNMLFMKEKSSSKKMIRNKKTNKNK